MSGISTQQELQIRELTATGNKISAVKLYREITGVGLKEAKDAVDAIQRGESVDIPTPAQVGETASALEDQIRRLLVERKKIDAVRIYRETHKCGLKEAKDAVDAIEAKTRVEMYANLPSTPAVRDDPFTEDKQRNRRFLSFILAHITLFPFFCLL